MAIGDYATGLEAGRRNEIQLAVTVHLTPRVHRIRMLGTAALDLAWVAAGRLDASITFGNNPWDIAAGAIIAREAGAIVTDTDGTPHTLASAATIAAPTALIPQLIPLLQAAATHDTQNPDAQMTATSPYADLDTVLARARYLIFDFDGPVCDLTAAMSPDTATQLHNTLRQSGDSLPPAASTNSPAGILAAVAAANADLAARIDQQITDIETDATTRAAPAGYIYEALAACRDSGRTPAIIASISTAAITRYLDRHGLDSQAGHVTALDGYPPGHLQSTTRLIEDSIHALGARPSECALITASQSRIQAARNAGLATVEYAPAPDASQQLADAGADSLLPSLADLALRLRARPLPN